jgi:hypothetical protein
MGWENLVDVCGHLHGKVGDYVYRYYPGIALQRVPYYTPTNPRTGKQQTWREIFAEAIAVWKALSDADKEVWNQEALRRGTRGTYLFRSWYLKTHRLTGQPFTVGETVIGSDDYIIAGEPITIGTWTIGSSEYIRNA